MRLILDVEIQGQPVQWARSRPGTSEDGEQLFLTAKKQKAYKGVVHDIATLAYRSAKARGEHDGKPLPLGTPCIFEGKVFVTIPASWKAQERADAMDGMKRPTGKPDLDNWLKLPMDACEGIAYANDSQIVGFGDSGIWYAQRPRLELRVWQLGPDGLSETEILRRALDDAKRANFQMYQALMETARTFGRIDEIDRTWGEIFVETRTAASVALGIRK